MKPFFVYLTAAVGGIIGGYILLLILMISQMLPIEGLSLGVIVGIYIVSWLVPFLLIRWWLIKSKVGSNKLGSGILTAVLVIIFIGLSLYMMGSPLRIFGPTRIVGGSPGEYQDGQIVWPVKKAFLGRQIRKGDVVLMNEPYLSQADGKQVNLNEPTGGSVAEVVGMPGEKMEVTVYDFFNNVMPSNIPLGYFVVEKSSSGVMRLLAESQITDVVVWP